MPSGEPAPRLRAPPEGLSRRLALVGPLLFSGIVMVQMFHFMEHVAQILQKYALSFGHSHGLLGHLVDREVVHFTYNVTLYAGLLLVLVAFGLRERWREGRRAWMTLLVATVALQSYHVLEHGVKLSQYFALGHDDTPGMIGQFVPVILAHFAINVIVFTPLMASWMLWRRARLGGVLDRPLAVALRTGARPWGPRGAPTPAPFGACPRLPLALASGTVALVAVGDAAEERPRDH